MASVEPPSDVEDLTLKVRQLEKRLTRERQARLKAEEIAEHGLRELFEKQEHLRLLEQIATQANLSDSVTDAFRFALNAIRMHCDAALGHVFMKSQSEGDHTLLSAAIWDGEEAPSLQSFKAVSTSLQFRDGAGLIGKVASSGQAIWIADLATDVTFLRRREAAAAGLRTGFAFPILVGAEVVAVVEFFSLTTKEPSEVMLAMLTQAGHQLGRVVERSRAEKKLRYDAGHDALTGLPNRRALLAKMEEGFWPKRRFKLLLIDLDRFKAVNDAFGHPTGDLLLVQVADRLQALMDQRGFVARLGGDEMAALVDGDLEAAITVAQDIIGSFAHPFDLGRVSVSISCSIGLCCTDDAASVMELMQQSDIALYEAKRNGRGQAFCYQLGMKERVAEQHRLEADMRLALARGEFHLAYQPVMTLADEQIVGYEALIRWCHPTRGNVPPSVFIPLAEQSDQIITIGRWVLEEACREAASWSNERHVAVNVSSVQLRSPYLLDELASALTTSGLPATRLEVEVTETALIESGDTVAATLTAIRALGIKVAMDDFGTGYSSLSHLRQLPFDRIKIDRSFVNTAASDPASLAVLKGVVQIGRDLGVGTLAEGVETEQQRALLKGLGCDVIQGFLVGRPERITLEYTVTA